jgi:Reverse transcriptase (RNA-dependent DNA polymerase)
VLKTKLDEKGQEERLKARLVPLGNHMRKGIDYNEIFAPTLKYTTLRLLLSLVAHLDYELNQLDVKNAFLNATVKEDVYTSLPEGFRTEDSEYVLKLVRALYGIHQAPREWYLLAKDFIVTELGFNQCVADCCLFWKRSQTGRLILMVMFVDDYGIAFHQADSNEWMALKKKFLNRFKSTDKGEAVHLLGMRITRDREKKSIVLDQEVYVTKKLEEFNMTEAATVSTPAVPGQNLSRLDDDQQSNFEETKPVNSKLYLQLVGALLYAAITTRPDIAHAVHELTMHSQYPLHKHWLAGKWVLRYLKGTRDIGLQFGGRGSKVPLDHSQDMVITGYSDADYANDVKDRKSISGWIVKLNGDVISWSSKKQSTVALSTCEAELYAEAACAQEVLWFQHLLSEMNVKVQKPSTIWVDNQSTIEISENGVIREKTKHVDVKYKFVNENVANKNIRVSYVKTQDQQADMLTKGLAKLLLEKHRVELMTR